MEVPADQKFIKLLLDIQQDLHYISERLQYYHRQRKDIHKQEWLNSREAMDYLHISKRKLWDLRKKHLIPFTVYQKKYFYKRSDLEALMQENYQQKRK